MSGIPMYDHERAPDCGLTIADCRLNGPRRRHDDDDVRHRPPIGHRYAEIHRALARFEQFIADEHARVPGGPARM